MDFMVKQELNLYYLLVLSVAYLRIGPVRIVLAIGEGNSKLPNFINKSEMYTVSS